MSRLVPVLIAVAAVTSACSESSIPVAELTTSTSEPVSVVETEAPTTTEAVATSTTQEPTTTKPAQPERYNPETAQAEIAALIEDFEDFWTFNNETPNPDDSRLRKIYTGGQLDHVLNAFKEVSIAGQLASGVTTVRPYPPALLNETRQTAEIAGCRLDAVSLQSADGTAMIAADDEPFEHFFELKYVEGQWRISANGRSAGEYIPCEL